MRIPLYTLALLAIALSSTSAIGQDEASANSQDPIASKTMEYLGKGSAYYLKHDFKKAIVPYQKALDLDKERPTLDKTLWKVLVDNLGMSYGITGNLKKAKEVFEYGISKDPDYPLFYYNMACTYGEMDDVDKAIDYLKLAFDKKENVIPGEKMPDPSTDPSFERFMKNEKFRNALKEINQK